MLVDTSVWIDHFRRDRPDLRARLEAGDVVSHPFVIGELACGTIRRRDDVLALLSTLPQVAVASHDEVLRLLDRHHLMGQGLGWVDAHLLASALLARDTLWTLDRSLARAAQALGVRLPGSLWTLSDR